MYVFYLTHGNETFCKHLDDKMFNLLFDHKVFSVKQKKSILGPNES